jgi:nanoRNase/pAp phosphatase (c-di-AMP/oligoRNAs hydrolase)
LLSLDRGHYVNDTEGFVEYAVSIKGVALAVFFCELEEHLFKVSLRSRCGIDVSVIARQFGGGGHKKAAGFRFAGPKHRLHKELLAEIGRRIEQHGLRPGDKFVEVTGREGEEMVEWIQEWAAYQ